MAAIQKAVLPVTVQLTLDLKVDEDQSNFDDVGDFHERFDLVNVTHGGVFQPDHFDQELYEFRFNFMHEELYEFRNGWREGDLAQMADALVDLVYVAMGTAQFLGLPWQEIWDEVQRANMTKIRAASSEESGEKTGRHHHFDVVKPDGFVPPDVRGILEQHGFQATWPVTSEDSDG
jgi:predicted HAD superfamily Cof-like phosphohydrolase